ncbi:23S rRNA (uracil(1939)-C(5))-methyltransferase RlmD [Streptococcus parauberis]|uniref:23S rRNA (uracil(1939)-C(5))-methyltransferase RlmD n=1 Tax=Streptococcus parauberis TaxID=1348 RepID=UPI000789AE1D|nr:23S rRNA (uracil(1939)-C(5))-methyltransferase RlmD [Streptococcus parauberis]KYP20340.1 23S rRNA (uracil-C(5))-methyltransferase RlmCD [Streptococcus parauberis]KYP22801.1 23S rRNA (uracil-C(5))-methyltransferase RlmCD [Streptococcus parauberis]KYP22808.1 23S rRNA (uracil-C(5))-methyltransferase RlmCD [Streptococcus parauberis]KYP25792.1 23S rRNA (uracil-C(5))-methyltransferase RlmCD [Streptococcus parauberis]KYP27939.1 23S rRNA (uracil-C(5))-methyltransferase RlmCD [Streptococcus parauber
MNYLKERQKIPLKIKRIGINGEGIGFYKKTLVFVPGALKGEDIFCQITSVKRNFVEAKLLTINKVSKDRVEPRCPIYKECGGCQIMHLAYPKQLVFKTDVIRQALKKFKPEGYESYPIRETLGMDEPWHYRAKLQFQTRQFGGKIRAGLFAENSHHLVTIENCLVQDKDTQLVINSIVKLLDKHKLPIFNELKIDGLRTVMIRKAVASKKIQVILITSKALRLTDFINDLVKEHPQIMTIALNHNKSKSSDIYGESTEIIWGEDKIEEEVLDYQFSLSPRAFYQLNPKQTQVLYQEVKNALQVTATDHIIDAYCGVGTIGFAFANQVASIRGMDIVPEAIADAKQNAQDLAIINTLYETGKAEEIIPKWYQSGYRADAIIVDPPRTGLDDKLLQTIITYQPEKMVYVSCNTSTLARDLVSLTKVYKVEYIQSVDMFPHTARTEAVVKLQKKEC